jgi:transcriptional regulator with XRE-family HTH domain
LLFDKISSLCEERGISIARLEREAELGNATVRGWKESDPSASKLKRVADVLNVTVDELLKDNGGDNN